jgi:hypothetical protein
MAAGQVTAFVIIGFLIAALVAGTILLSGKVSVDRGTAAAERQQVRAELVKPVQQYITQCLEQALVQGIEYLGRQGGYIYISQDGPMPDPVQAGTVLEREGVQVRYLIFPPVGTVGVSYFSEPPEYPWPTFPRVFNATGGLKFSRFFSGYFGRNLLPALGRGNPGSLQDQLDYFINVKMGQCRLDAFESQGLSFDLGEPNTTTTLATADTTAALSWPVTIRDTASAARTDLDAFAARTLIRLNATYTLIRQLIDREVTEVNFTLAGIYGDAFTVDAIPDAGGPGEDVFQVRDSRSQLRGAPFLFQFARHNRPPALFQPAQELLDELISQAHCPGTSLSLEQLPPALSYSGTTAPGALPPFKIYQARLTITSPASDDAPCDGRIETRTTPLVLEGIDPDEDNLIFACDPACPVTLSAGDITQYVTLFDARWPFTIQVTDAGATDHERLELQVST